MYTPDKTNVSPAAKLHPAAQRAQKAVVFPLALVNTSWSVRVRCSSEKRRHRHMADSSTATWHSRPESRAMACQPPA